MQVEMIEKGDEVEAGKSPTNNSTDETVVPKPPKEKRTKKLTKKVANHELTASSKVSAPLSPATGAPQKERARARKKASSPLVPRVTPVPPATPVALASSDTAVTAVTAETSAPLATPVTAVPTATSARGRGAHSTTAAQPSASAPAATGSERQQNVSSNAASTWRERRQPSLLVENREGMSVDDMLKVLQTGRKRAPTLPSNNQLPKQGYGEDDADDLIVDENELKLDTDSDVHPEEVAEGGGSESCEAVPTENGSDESDDQYDTGQRDSDDDAGGDKESDHESEKQVTSSSVTRSGCGPSKRVQKGNAGLVPSATFYVSDKADKSARLQPSAHGPSRDKNSTRSTAKETAPKDPATKSKAKGSATPKPKPKPKPKASKPRPR